MRSSFRPASQIALIKKGVNRLIYSLFNYSIMLRLLSQCELSHYSQFPDNIRYATLPMQTTFARLFDPVIKSSDCRHTDINFRTQLSLNIELDNFQNHFYCFFHGKRRDKLIFPVEIVPAGKDVWSR